MFSWSTCNSPKSRAASWAILGTEPTSSMLRKTGRLFSLRWAKLLDLFAMAGGEAKLVPSLAVALSNCTLRERFLVGCIKSNVMFGK